VDGAGCSVTQATSPPLVDTLYRKVVDLQRTLAPTARPSGLRMTARCGSGRDGRAWRTHDDLSALTIC